MKNLFALWLLLCADHMGFAQEAKLYTSQNVEQFPVFQKIKCLQDGTEACFANQLNEHIVQNFNYPLEALQNNVKGKVFVQFVIDSVGEVGNIKTRSLHRVFEVEGERIIKKIPRLTPPKIDGKSVSMVYNIPITFNMMMGDEFTTIPSTLNIDYSDDRVTELISWENAKSPPVLESSSNEQEKSSNFEKILKERIAASAVSKGYKTATTTSAKIYFEINRLGGVSNVNVMSIDLKLKILIEQFIYNDLKIAEPAKDDTNQPIPCFITSDIYFSKIK